MQDIRLIALDLDGTVFNDEKVITARTLTAMQQAIARGVDVIPATGRTVAGVPQEFLKLPGVRYALTSNGASVVELATGRRIAGLPFKAELTGPIYDLVAHSGGALSVFVNGRSYTDEFSSEAALQFFPASLHPYLRSSRTVVKDMHELFRLYPHDVEKFSIAYPDAATRDAAWKAVADRFDVEITSSIPNNMEINAPGVSKGRGLELLAETLGLSMNQVMACGDSGNDLTMVRAAGLGVAMANATPDVLAAADYITDDNNHDGVAKAIEKFVLQD
ncbi:MAG: Cof-type HAD-IIB family hydrolase [Gemmiger sp.]|uniref:Cof-type HAD-IIB family hydrolase n=1 Tax=Gemmiger sp. TaxID=2049027 RepID=UPI002E78A6BA|nr:Cof-type HAD-IIB family hydrolase [Gemmiger sp.]MEE0800010.1 Cof-type HAD-IIB family hydrolase [Gemmiger sp.]